jgi:hypothetical protein
MYPPPGHHRSYARLLAMLRSVLVLVIQDARVRPNNRTPPALHIARLLGIVVINQQLAALAVAMRHVVRNLDDIEGARRLVEDLVHLLERAVGRLREEKVHAGHHGRVDDSKNDVRLVSNVCKCDWRDHDDHEVEDPVCCRRDGVCGGADGEGGDFGGVEPGHSEPADGEEGVEDEEHYGLGVVSGVWWEDGG